MHILSYHPERGDIKVKIESLEDLWHLDHILAEGDLVRAKTLRRQDQRHDALRPQKTEKKRVFLTIRVEKIEFHPHTNWLRVTGVIQEGEDTGSYHTLNLEEGTVCTITKEWRHYHIARLKEAVEQSAAPKILLIVLDDEKATFGMVRQYGVDEIATVYSHIPGKREPSQRKKAKTVFYEEISKKMLEYDVPSIVAGPGFTKEEFRAYFKNKYQKEVIIESVSTTGRTGLYEAVKKGLVEKVYQDSKTAQDIQLVEELFSAIIKGDGVYGFKDVVKAVDYNACERLLAVDTLVRQRRDVETLLEKTRTRGGESHIISSYHEGGEKLLSLGGIAAFLRFKIE